MAEPIFARREVFEQILEYAVIPTFDLVIALPSGGVVTVKRKIPPYDKKWALPGLRMYKNETIEQTLNRIARQELGVTIDTENRLFLGQYVGKFTTEHHRQDLSTGFLVQATSSHLSLNKDHFSDIKILKTPNDLPTPMGAMYSFYLKRYFEQQA